MKKRKYVKESLDEQWVSSDTGLERYYDHSSPQPEQETSPEITRMVPPADQKFTRESFEQYVSELLINQVLPQSPVLALKIFTEVLKLHPYLTRKIVGFNAQPNPYQPVIQKFLETFKNMVHK